MNIEDLKDMREEIKVYLLALNQLDQRKATLNASREEEAYEKHYYPIERFIMKKLRFWNFPLKRAM